MRKTKRATFIVHPPFLKTKKGSCRICGEPCVGRRKVYCGKQCYHEAQRRIKRPRDHVFERDGGICAICGKDTETDRKLSWQIYNHAAPLYGHQAAAEFRTYLLKCWGYNPKKALWENDHKVPLVLGGSDTLDNMRTLCNRCHQKCTQNLARKRAKIRVLMCQR